MPDTTRRGAARASVARPAARASAAPTPSPRSWAVPAVVAAVALLAGGAYVVTQGDESVGAADAPYVGGDLHTVTAVDDKLYVGGHDGVAVSTDGGQTWESVPSLDGADAMGWAQTDEGLFVGGHPGLYRSSDNGATFAKSAVADGQVSDIHALGAAGDVAYLASPAAGLLASTDGGTTWESRNADVGQGFMGTVLVDPTDPDRLIAPDMQNGLVTSSDGGTTWTVLGGPSGAMSAAWDPTDTERIVAVGMGGGALSSDGGQTWSDLALPSGTSAATYSSDGRSLYAAALDGDTARVWVSTDGGATWREV